jgi:hypothetical protein
LPRDNTAGDNTESGAQISDYYQYSSALHI